MSFKNAVVKLFIMVGGMVGTLKYALDKRDEKEKENAR